MRNYLGSLLKLSPDGRHLDKSFADSGILPAFSPSNQILVSQQEKRIYIGGSRNDAWGTGVYSLEKGAFLYQIGGYAGNDRKTTSTAGICLGKGSKIYIGGGSVYDRTKPLFEGYLANGLDLKRHAAYPPVTSNYWGPCMEQAPEDDMFYFSSYGSDICKIQDTNLALSESYFAYVDGNPVGMSLDSTTHLLYAALRTAAGQVAVLFDDGLSLKEVTRLKDGELGTTHAVRYRDGYLYVVEDGARPIGYDDYFKNAHIPAEGKNRLSRYRISFDKETDITVIERR